MKSFIGRVLWSLAALGTAALALWWWKDFTVFPEWLTFWAIFWLLMLRAAPERRYLHGPLVGGILLLAALAVAGLYWVEDDYQRWRMVLLQAWGSSFPALQTLLPPTTAKVLPLANALFLALVVLVKSVYLPLVQIRKDPALNWASAWHDTAYQLHQDRWYFKPWWTLARWLGVVTLVAGGVLHAYLVWGVSSPSAVWLSFLPAACWALGLEWYQWLSGPINTQSPESTEPDHEILDETQPDFNDLWVRYRQRWPMHWMVAGNRLPDVSPASLADLQTAVRQGQGVVLNTYPDLRVLQCLQALVAEVAGRGGHVLVLADATSPSQHEALETRWACLLRDARRQPLFTDGTAHLCTPGQLSPLLREPENAAWFDRLELLLVPQGEQLLERPYTWELMALVLRDRLQARSQALHPRCVVLMQPRHAPEPAVRDALPLYASGAQAWSEFTFNATASQPHWWNVWTHRQVHQYASGLLPRKPDALVGVALPLAQFAGRWGIPTKANAVPWWVGSGEKDHHQALQGCVGQTLYDFSNEPDKPWADLPRWASHTGCMTRSETEGNPWRELARIAHACQGRVLVNIVCRDSMLSAYLVSEADYFAANPLNPLSPLMSHEVPRDTAIQLLERLEATDALPLETVRQALVAAHAMPLQQDPKGIDTFGMLKALVTSELGIGIANRLCLQIRSDWQGQPGRQTQGTFVTNVWVRILPRLANDNLLPWLHVFSVCDEAGNAFHSLRRDHVDQQFWPGRIVSLGGSKFKVDSVQHDQRRVLVTQQDTLVLSDYRLQRQVSFNKSEARRIDREAHTDDMSNGVQLQVESFIADFSVSNLGCTYSDDHWCNLPHFQPFTQPLTRRYDKGRAWRLRLASSLSAPPLLSPGAAIALAAWINEAAVTLLPEVAPFVLAVPQVAEEYRPKDEVANRIVPSLTGSNIPHNPESAQVNCVWVFEDSNADLGIVRTLTEHRHLLLDLCHDWLTWHQAAVRETTPRDIVLLNTESDILKRDWFAWGQAQRDSAIDLPALHKALEPLISLFNKYTPHRSRVGSDRPLLDSHTDPLGTTTCDFCSVTLPPISERNVLEDGRIACQPCRQVGVGSIHQINQLLNNVAWPFYREAHDIQADDFGSVRIELVNQSQLAEAQGKKYIPTSGFDLRAVGLAMSHGRARRSDKHLQSGSTQTGKGQPTILIESGFSPEETVSTLVHELCHIWQYRHLNYPRMQQDHQELLIEGHATWAEDSLLSWEEKQPIADLDRRRMERTQQHLEHRKRADDTYGKGYRLIKAQLSWRHRSAFRYLKSNYPSASND